MFLQKKCKNRKQKKRHQLTDLQGSFSHDTVLVLLPLETHIFNIAVLIDVYWCESCGCNFGGMLFSSCTWICFFIQVWEVFSHKFIKYILTTFSFSLFLPRHSSYASVGVLNVVKHCSHYSHFSFVFIFSESFPWFYISVNLCILLYHLVYY